MLERAERHWDAAPGFLDTATYGLPPRAAWDALQSALADWRMGRTSWEPWAATTEEARAHFAALVSVSAERVAQGATVSELIGLVAAAVRPGRLLCPQGDFTSLTWPWAAQGFEVIEVPLEELVGRIDAATDVVAFSAVQSADGRRADLAAIADAAAAYDALTVVDATQAIGWLPFDATGFDVVACAAYKWLCSPRGTAFAALSERLVERTTPRHAGWYAGETPTSSYYGAELRLAGSARQFDTSPAWFSWVGTAPALAAFLDVGVERIHGHVVGLANRFRAGLGLEPSDSAIVRTEVEHATARLAAAGVRAASRAGAVRASFHLYTSEADVDAALDALVPAGTQKVP